MASVESCFLEALIQYRTRSLEALIQYRNNGSSSQYRTLVNTREKKTEWGYLQVDNFRSKWSHLKEALPEDAKHWVALPEGTVVHSYPKDASSPSCGVVPVSCMKKPQQPDCSRTIKQLSDEQCKDAACTEEMCIHQSPGDSITCNTTMKTSYTSLPNKKMRQVRFCDSICKGSDIVPALSSNCPAKQERESDIAQWIYIDRDICGVSLHQYAPEVDRDFASSDYGQAFCTDLKALESVCQQASKESSNGFHDKEEKLLDKALESAKLRASFYSLASPAKARRPFYFHPDGCSKSQRHPG